MSRLRRNDKQNTLKKLFTVLLSTVKDFLSATSLHGFHWITDAQRKHKGRIYNILTLTIWLVSVFSGLCFGLYLMTLVWKRYAISPTITTIETNNYPIANVPFPGVTICNINTVYKPNTFEIINQLKTYGVSEDKANMFFTKLSALINYKEVDETYLAIYDILAQLGYNASSLMLKLSHPCKKMLKSCHWLEKQITCKKFFRTTKTGFGYCCSFNYQALRNDLEIETNFDEYSQINAPLIKTSGAGEDVSLRVALDVEAKNYLAPKRLFYGTEIIIHDPEEFPEKTLLTAFGQQGTDVSVAVRVSVVDSVKEVAKLPVNLRFCRFSNEISQQITRKYTFQSCITECREKTIIQICKCLPFTFPSQNVKYKTIRQCGLRDVKCLYDNKNIFASLGTGQTHKTKGVGGMSCDCLPSCTEQNYSADTFISNRVNGIGIPNTEDSISNLSSVIVYFKDLSCIKYRRELFKTWDDFLASFGGIFGLCLGGSVISLIEILFHFTFQFVENYISAGKIHPASNQLNKKNFTSPKINKKHASTRVFFLQ